MTARPALLITSDDLLLEDVLRLAAAAGLTLDVAHDPDHAMPAWPLAAAVLVGADQASGVAALRPGRRDGVHLISSGPAGEATLREAVGLGAGSVVELPEGAEWLVEVLTDVADDEAGDGVVLGVVGGSGGVGATTFACGLALTAAAGGSAMLVDLDRFGPGVGRVVGLDGLEGVAWPDLAATPGRLGSRALREALPTIGRLGVLSWPAGPAYPLGTGLVREVLSAARRGHRTVILDLPRRLDEETDVVLARCRHVVVVSGADLAGVASAARTVAALRDRVQALSLVVRAGPLSPPEVGATLGVPVLAELRHQRRLAEHLDLGLGPLHVRRGPVATAARAVLDGLS